MLQPAEIIASLSSLDARIQQDRYEQGAYVLTFQRNGATITICIVLDDYSDADVVINFMTTLPDQEKGRGHGSRALNEVLIWASSLGFKDIRAVQVQKLSESFWIKNGFVRLPDPNVCNDYQLESR